MVSSPIPCSSKVLGAELLSNFRSCLSTSMIFCQVLLRFQLCQSYATSHLPELYCTICWPNDVEKMHLLNFVLAVRTEYQILKYVFVDCHAPGLKSRPSASTSLPLRALTNQLIRIRSFFFRGPSHSRISSLITLVTDILESLSSSPKSSLRLQVAVMLSEGFFLSKGVMLSE